MNVDAPKSRYKGNYHGNIFEIQWNINDCWADEGASQDHLSFLRQTCHGKNRGAWPDSGRLAQPHRNGQNRPFMEKCPTKMLQTIGDFPWPRWISRGQSQEFGAGPRANTGISWDSEDILAKISWPHFQKLRKCRAWILPIGDIILSHTVCQLNMCT